MNKVSWGKRLLMSNSYINSLFYITFFFMFFTRYVGLDVPGENFYILYIIGKVSAFLISLLFVLKDILSKKLSANFILVLFFISYISFNTGDYFIMISFMVICALRNIKVERLIYIGLFLSSISILYTILVVLFRYGAYDSLDYILDDRFGIRLSLNYPHPNAFPYRFFIFLCLYSLVRKRILFLELLLWGSISYIIYIYSGSRTGFLASILLLIIIYILSHYHVMKHFLIRITIIYSYAIASFFSIFTALLFNDYDVLSVVNSLSSGRVSDSYRLFQEMGISFFPRNISEHLRELNSPMDNFYNYTLASSGVIFIVVFNVLTIKLLKLMYSFQLSKEIIVLCMVGIYGMLEKGMLDISLNIFLVYYIFLIYKDKITLYKRSVLY